jgi:hypothetical protein
LRQGDGGGFKRHGDNLTRPGRGDGRGGGGGRKGGR